MANLRKWSTSASGNATVAGGANTINFAEGQSAGSVNNSAREMMAQVRSIYTPAEWGWVEHSATASVTSQTVFKLAGNQTSNFTAGRRLRLKSGSSTRYGAIVSSSYTVETTITCTVDSGSLSGSHSLVALAAIDSNHVPAVSAASTAAAGIVELASQTETNTGTDATRAVTPDGLAALLGTGGNSTDGATITIGNGSYHNLITSTTAITAFSITTDWVGRTFRCRFATIRTLTHNGTSLILPGSANITTASGDIAQFRSLGSGNVVCEWYSRGTGVALVETPSITAATMQATTSGTAIDFTSIPSTVKRITIMFRGVSTNGTEELLVQIGDAGGIENSGYISTATNEASTAANNTTGFIVTASSTAAEIVSGTVVLTLMDAATFAWIASGTLKSTTSRTYVSAGDKALSATLDRVRITTTSADTFDAGSINIMYE